ncbi:MAG: GNAT family N-acetyltransferase [Litorilinea sp.]
MPNPGNSVGAHNPEPDTHAAAGHTAYKSAGHTAELGADLANHISYPAAIPEQMPVNYVLAPLNAEHARIAARLHIAGQPGTFLTQLGPEILEIIYRALPEAGFGFVALMPHADCDDTPGDTPDNTGQTRAVCGFISGAPGIGGVFVKALTGEGGRRGLRLLRGLTRRLLRKPALIRHLFATLLYPLRSSHPSPVPPRAAAAETAAKTIELLSIMVDPGQRSQGIGGQLIHAFEAASRAQQATSIQVTVDARNAGARRFYADHGFQLQQEFRLYGRPMTLYRKAIA